MNANIWVPDELGGSPWRPVVDANDRDKFYTFLENSPQALRNGGKFYNISVMLGVTSDEGAFKVADCNHFFYSFNIISHPIFIFFI